MRRCWLNEHWASGEGLSLLLHLWPAPSIFTWARNTQMKGLNILTSWVREQQSIGRVDVENSWLFLKMDFCRKACMPLGLFWCLRNDSHGEVKTEILQAYVNSYSPVPEVKLLVPFPRQPHFPDQGSISLLRISSITTWLAQLPWLSGWA